jgi:hypothetical protein
MEEQSRASARNRNELSHVASRTLDVQKSVQVQGPSKSEAHAGTWKVYSLRCAVDGLLCPSSYNNERYRKFVQCCTSF